MSVRCPVILTILISAFSTSYAFGLQTPAAVSPQPGAQNIHGITITYQWEEQPAASSYDFLIFDRNIAKISYRNRSVPASVCSAGICSYQPPDTALLPVSKNHVWRVAAADQNEKSDFSYTLFDVVIPLDTLSIPIPVAPQSATQIDESISITYQWEEQYTASSYDFLIFDRTQSTVSYRNRSVPSSVCSTGICSYQPSDNSSLPVSNNHVWRVAAINENEKSDFSYTLFDVVTPLENLSTPITVAPITDAEIEEGVSIMYQWEEQVAASSYDFLIFDRVESRISYRDRSVSTSVCTVGVCSYQPPETALLPVSNNHVWRVAAANQNEKSDFSYSLFDVVEAQTTPVIDETLYELVFEDNFNGSSLDLTKWDSSLLWGPYFPINNEEQMYVDTLGMHREFEHTPFQFTGSSLKITATATDSSLQPPPRPPQDDPAWNTRSYSEYRYNGPTEQGEGYSPDDVNYLSGMITTYDSLKLTHGYVEMRARIPAGRGLWPAFWLLPTHYVEDVPEIDVMEFLGQDVDRIYHTYHYFDIQNNWTKISTPSFTTFSDDWTQQFHTFGMAWSPTEIIWYINGIETQRITRSDYTIPNQSMYILANLAVGGNWPGTPDANTVFPAIFEIDYIRAYKRKLNPQLDLAADYQLMFEDNFNGTSLDATKWNTHFLWGPYLAINNEEQYYVDSLGSDASDTTTANSPFVLNNGVLSITARKADDLNSFPIPTTLPGVNESIWSDYAEFQRAEQYSPGNYTSGLITSYDAFKFSYGYAEIRAKVPSGDGLWPAFWLLNGYYVNRQPEIDVMEVRGEFPSQIVHSYHRLDEGVMTSDSATTDTRSIDYSQAFHNYGVRWQPGRIDWYIDGDVVHTYTGNDVGYQVMYLLANLAVGGDFSNGTPVDESRFDNPSPVSLDIDYIRVYQEKHKQ